MSTLDISVKIDDEPVEDMSDEDVMRLIEDVAGMKQSIEISSGVESLVAESSGKGEFIIYWHTGANSKKSIALDLFSTDDVKRYFSDFVQGGELWKSQIEWEEDTTQFPWQVVVYFFFFLLVLWSAVKHIFLK